MMNKLPNSLTDLIKTTEQKEMNSKNMIKYEVRKYTNGGNAIKT